MLHIVFISTILYGLYTVGNLSSQIIKSYIFSDHMTKWRSTSYKENKQAWKNIFINESSKIKEHLLTFDIRKLYIFCKWSKCFEISNQDVDVFYLLRVEVLLCFYETIYHEFLCLLWCNRLWIVLPNFQKL